MQDELRNGKGGLLGYLFYLALSEAGANKVTIRELCEQKSYHQSSSYLSVSLNIILMTLDLTKLQLQWLR